MSDTPYIVSARKYRPADFKSVVGQKNLTATLKNAIETGRLAQAYLFCGPRGVGKTSCARIFAKTINCLSPTPEGEACGHCESCRAIEEGNSFNIVELDAASNNSVDDIRSLTEQVNIPPTVGKYRTFIIDEVHMLTSQAFNAFLKTLEEPPAYVVFILATTEKHKVIPTILSRCQIYDFKRITIQDMVEHLQYVASSEGISTDVPSLNVIAKKADGAMRDALSIFDQVAASSAGNITYESTIASLNVLDYDFYFQIVEACRAGDIPKVLMIYKEIRDRGFDSLFFINGLANHVRDLMVAYSPQTSTLLEVADDVAAQYTAQAKSLPVDWHYAAMKILNDCDYKYRTASNKQFLIELTLIKLCQLLNPPTAPFDQVDNDSFPLRDIVVPQTASAPAADASVAPQNPPTPQTPLPPTATSSPGASSPGAAGATPQAPASAGTPASSDNTQPAPASPIQRRRKRSGSTPDTFRLNEEASTSRQTLGERQQLHEPVEPNAFMEAWDSYISRNPDKHILVSSMRKSRPEPIDSESFRVLVEHPAVRQAFESEMADLINYLRETLRNDALTIKVEIDASKEVLKQLPPQEMLKEMIEKNSALADYIASIDAEIV